MAPVKRTQSEMGRRRHVHRVGRVGEAKRIRCTHPLNLGKKLGYDVFGGVDVEEDKNLWLISMEICGYMGLVGLCGAFLVDGILQNGIGEGGLGFRRAKIIGDFNCMVRCAFDIIIHPAAIKI